MKTGRPAVTVAVEGPSDVPVVKRILDWAGLEMGPVHGLRGKSWIDQHLPGYNRAARHARWMVLRDLNRDAACAPDLLQRLLPDPAPSMRLRIAVHATETWLLADADGLSQFLGVSAARMPRVPEDLPDPKQTLIELARTSRSAAIREDMAPAPGTSARVGPGYSGRIIEFVTRSWRPEVAARQSDSLSRCMETLRRWSTT